MTIIPITESVHFHILHCSQTNRVETVNEEDDDVIEVEDEPPVCPTHLEVDKTLEVFQKPTLFCKNNNKMKKVVEKVNTYAQMRVTKLRKKTINYYFQKI